jgi:hypothetical protein
VTRGWPPTGAITVVGRWLDSQSHTGGWSDSAAGVAGDWLTSHLHIRPSRARIGSSPSGGSSHSVLAHSCHNLRLFTTSILGESTRILTTPCHSSPCAHERMWVSEKVGQQDSEADADQNDPTDGLGPLAQRLPCLPASQEPHPGDEETDYPNGQD